MTGLSRTVTLTLVNNQSGDRVAAIAAAQDAKNAFLELSRFAKKIADDIASTIANQMNKNAAKAEGPVDPKSNPVLEALTDAAVNRGETLGLVATAVDADAITSRKLFDKDIIHLVSDGLEE